MKKTKLEIPIIPISERLASCGCAETQIKGDRLPFVKFHDCKHIAERNSFIIEADAFARRETGHLAGTIKGQAYTRVLSMKMEELCAHLYPQPTPQNA